MVGTQCSLHAFWIKLLNFGIIKQNSTKGVLVQNIQIQIEDKYLDTFLTLVNSLKKGIVKNIHIDENKQNKQAKEYFHSSLAAIEDGSEKLISHDEVWEKVAGHIKANS